MEQPRYIRCGAVAIDDLLVKLVTHSLAQIAAQGGLQHLPHGGQPFQVQKVTGGQPCRRHIDDRECRRRRVDLVIGAVHGGGRAAGHDRVG